MPNAIRLQIINLSNDQNNSQVVVFQRNTATSLEELAVAWQVITNLGHGSRHPFAYDLDAEIGASDSWGNFTPLFPAPAGSAYEMVRTASGDGLQPAAPFDAVSISLANALDQGAINALIYRSGKLAATRTGISPGQKAVFEFRPIIWVGVVSQIEEGEVINAAIISSINTQFSLRGIKSADIVWKGGGGGHDSTPFTFTLENVQYGSLQDSEDAGGEAGGDEAAEAAPEQ
jgi:hypothetical protein